MLRSVLILGCALFLLSASSACGDGPDKPTPTSLPVQGTKAPSLPVSPPQSAARSFGCSPQQPIVSFAVPLAKEAYYANNTQTLVGFRVTGCFSDLGVVQLTNQLGAVLSEAILKQNAITPFNDSEQLSSFATKYLADFMANVLSQSNLTLNGASTGQKIWLDPVIETKKTNIS